jgi:acyl carrier protein
MEDQMIAERIREFIGDHFPSARRGKLGSQDALLENGIIDSLGVLDLVSFMEETFAITVMDEELLPENFQTIERLTKFVESKSNGKSSS